MNSEKTTTMLATTVLFYSTDHKVSVEQAAQEVFEVCDTQGADINEVIAEAHVVLSIVNDIASSDGSSWKPVQR